MAGEGQHSGNGPRINAEQLGTVGLHLFHTAKRLAGCASEYLRVAKFVGAAFLVQGWDLLTVALCKCLIEASELDESKMFISCEKTFFSVLLCVSKWKMLNFFCMLGSSFEPVFAKSGKDSFNLL